MIERERDSDSIHPKHTLQDNLIRGENGWRHDIFLIKFMYASLRYQCMYACLRKW